jgi:hypothetical protein
MTIIAFIIVDSQKNITVMNICEKQEWQFRGYILSSLELVEYCVPA